MSQYNSVAVATAFKKIARKTVLGGEKKVYVSPEAAVLIGSGLLSAADAAAYTADAVNVLPGAGADLQVVLNTALVTAGKFAITITGTNEDDEEMTGLAEFDKIGYVNNQGYSFPINSATDVIPSIVGKKFKTISAVAVVNGAAFVEFSIWQLPELTSYTLCPSITDVSFNTKSQAPISIPDGMNGTAERKLGRSEESKLSITELRHSLKEGLARFDGVPITVRVELVLEKKVVTDRMIFTDFSGTSKPKYGDGSALAESVMDGLYEELLVFSAI